MSVNYLSIDFVSTDIYLQTLLSVNVPASTLTRQQTVQTDLLVHISMNRLVWQYMFLCTDTCQYRYLVYRLTCQYMYLSTDLPVSTCICLLTNLSVHVSVLDGA